MNNMKDKVDRLIFISLLLNSVLGAKMTKLHKCYWLLNNIANIGSPAVTLLYWTSVYNKGKLKISLLDVLLYLKMKRKWKYCFKSSIFASLHINSIIVVEFTVRQKSLINVLFLCFLDLHELDFGNIHGHVMNTVLVVIDLLVTAHPVRLLHCVHPIGLTACYTLFSFVYYCAGGTNKRGDYRIYPFLNWQKPEVFNNTIITHYI
jgi:hypothetical protein